MMARALLGAVAVASIVIIVVVQTRPGESPIPRATPDRGSERVRTLGSTALQLEDVTQSMAVGDAYRAIPHQRTPFDPSVARMDISDARYLDTLFALTDLAMVERVQTQLRLQSGSRDGGADENYVKILAHLDSIESPQRLERVRSLIRNAIDEQRRYLAMWRESGDTGYFSPAAPLVRSSSGKLIAAYNDLMALYAQEGAHNRQAFFDHLCALDFI